MLRRLAVSALFLSLTLSVFALRCHQVDHDEDPKVVKVVECGEKVQFCQDLILKNENLSYPFKTPGCGARCTENGDTVINDENGKKLSRVCCSMELCNSPQYVLGPAPSE